MCVVGSSSHAHKLFPPGGSPLVVRIRGRAVAAPGELALRRVVLVPEPVVDGGVEGLFEVVERERRALYVGLRADLLRALPSLLVGDGFLAVT